MTDVSTTVRVSETTRDRLAALAKQRGKPMIDVVEEAVDALERRVFWDAVDAGYEVLRRDEDAWAQVLAERAEWDGTLRDGLD